VLKQVKNTAEDANAILSLFPVPRQIAPLLLFPLPLQFVLTLLGLIHWLGNNQSIIAATEPTMIIVAAIAEAIISLFFSSELASPQFNTYKNV
jgi:hypothetical protein